MFRERCGIRAGWKPKPTVRIMQGVPHTFSDIDLLRLSARAAKPSMIGLAKSAYSPGSSWSNGMMAFAPKLVVGA